jgi:hypothetical protein
MLYLSILAKMRSEGVADLRSYPAMFFPMSSKSRYFWRLIAINRQLMAINRD